MPSTNPIAWENRSCLQLLTSDLERDALGFRRVCSYHEIERARLEGAAVSHKSVQSFALEKVPGSPNSFFPSGNVALCCAPPPHHARSPANPRDITCPFLQRSLWPRDWPSPLHGAGLRQADPPSLPKSCASSGLLRVVRRGDLDRDTQVSLPARNRPTRVDRIRCTQPPFRTAWNDALRKRLSKKWQAKHSIRGRRFAMTMLLKFVSTSSRNARSRAARAASSAASFFL